MDEQTTPKKVRRVGSIAFALVLIAAGVLLIVYQLVPQFDLLKILKFSPVILIALGIEMLVYSQKTEAMYNALSTEPELKARTNSLSVNVWFNHETHGNYTLQDGDDCILHTELVNDYVDAETFAADCMAVMQAAQAENLGFTRYSFSTDEDIDDGISYYLDCVASYPAGLTAAQVAQRVQTSYHYDNNSFSSEADRDDYIRRQLQNEISDEYADRHDGDYPDEKYLNEETERRFAERTGMATPESAQA